MSIQAANLVLYGNSLCSAHGLVKLKRIFVIDTMFLVSQSPNITGSRKTQFKMFSQVRAYHVLNIAVWFE